MAKDKATFNKAKNDNNGHRQRLKHRYLTQGADDMEDRRLLELLLTYSLPRVDVYPHAKALLEHFGDLENILSARVDELCSVSGVGENTAVLISLVNSLHRKSALAKLRRGIYKSSEQIAELFCTLFTDLREERFALAMFDSSRRLLGCDWISKGNSNECVIDLRRLLQLLSRDNISYVAIAHNHPGGDLTPSSEDIASAYKLRQRIEELSIELIDMYLVCGDRYYHMSEAEKLALKMNEYVTDEYSSVFENSVTYDSAELAGKMLELE